MDSPAPPEPAPRPEPPANPGSSPRHWGVLYYVILDVVAGGVAYLGYGYLRISSPAAVAHRGYQDLEAGRNEQAARQFEQALARDPDQPDWWLNLGAARQRLGDYGGSVAAYKRAAFLRPEDHKYRSAWLEAVSNWGDQKLKTGDVAGAVELYREARTVDPGLAAAWLNLGMALLKAGQAGRGRDGSTTGSPSPLDTTAPPSDEPDAVLSPWDRVELRAAREVSLPDRPPKTRNCYP